MTVLAAILDRANHRAWMASDSSATSGTMVHGVPAKITRVGPALIGTCGTPVGDIYLRQLARTPPAEGWPADYSSAVAWLDWLALDWRQWARDRQLGDKDDGSVSWWATVAMPWGLWHIDPNGAVVEVAEDYAANGSGALCALGVLWAWPRNPMVGPTPESALSMAVEAAIAHADGCGGPVRIETTEAKA